MKMDEAAFGDDSMVNCSVFIAASVVPPLTGHDEQRPRCVSIVVQRPRD